MQVRVGTIPGTINQFAVTDNAVVDDALRAAGLDAEGFTTTVNGSGATGSTMLRDGDLVMLTKNAKGNS